MTAVKKYLLFKAVDQLLACPLENIDEVADPVEVTHLPNTAEWFQGIATRKGRLLPVSDFGSYLSDSPSRISASAKWLLLTVEGETIALTVDGVVGLADADSQTSIEQEASLSGADQRLADLVSGQLQVSGETAYLVELNSILEQEKFVEIGVSR